MGLQSPSSVPYVAEAVFISAINQAEFNGQQLAPKEGGMSSLFSLACSNTSVATLNSAPYKNFAIPVTSRSVSSLKSSPFSRRLYTNGYWISHRNKIRAKTVDSDNGTGELASEGGGGGSGSASTSLLSILCPLLKLFSGGDPSKNRSYYWEEATSSLSTLARFPWGSRSLADADAVQNQETSSSEPKLLQLFEFEACPFCRRVREAMTELDLCVEVYPCPKGSVRHRQMVREFGGKEQFPFLIDPNTGISMYESGDIVKYLFQQYGEGKGPSTGLLESTLFTGWMPTILRAGRGMTLWDKARLDAPPQKLELFSYENNPHARIVREAFCELELPYILYNVGEGSHRRKLLLDMSGSQEVPYMIDPNTGAQIGDYKKILPYLFETYSLATV